MVLKVAFLGPAGTYSQVALKSYYKLLNYEEVPCDSIESIFNEVANEKVDAGIIPIENSCEGAVNQSMDLLAYNYRLYISGEIIMPVYHSLLAKSGTQLSDVRTVLSHSQAIAQCRESISKAIPNVNYIEVSSTADAIQRVSNMGNEVAAIGNKLAGETYGLNVLKDNINDHTNNETRFVIISKSAGECMKNCKTSLLVNVLNEPGALFQALKEFSLRGINLTKIESRPAKTKIGEYLFFIDIDGHYLEPRIQDALESIEKVSQSIKVLGSYPKAASRDLVDYQSMEGLDYLRQEIDIIDENIIDLLARRTKLVKRIGKLKRTVAEVHDPYREEKILERLKTYSLEKGFSSEITEKIYTILFKHFVSLQKNEKQ